MICKSETFDYKRNECEFSVFSRVCDSVRGPFQLLGRRTRWVGGLLKKIQPWTTEEVMKEAQGTFPTMVRYLTTLKDRRNTDRSCD